MTLHEQAPVSIEPCGGGTWLVDFGRVAFGNAALAVPSGAHPLLTVHFGEAQVGGRIDRHPPGSVRYACCTVHASGHHWTLVAPAPDDRNSGHPSAVLTPLSWGTLIPFRWLEIEGWEGSLDASMVVRRAAWQEGWDEHASAFLSSDPMLDRIWDLSRYSIKATTFAGIYVDGDRERIAYEADAYIQQLGHYCIDQDVRMARCTFDHLMRFPTWPTEWSHHMIFMAYADWMHTGDAAWLSQRYEWLKSKLLLERLREDGLLSSSPRHIEKGDLVDWPAIERDGYVFTSINAVVNAFFLHALDLMAAMAAGLGRIDDARGYSRLHARARQSFLALLFDVSRGLFRDGEGTEHTSLHANLFPLAFGLFPPTSARSAACWLADRGMRCSPYAAQYLLEALFRQDLGGEAIRLMCAPGDRSWRHMVESGATITWEAWDHRYKPNQDWNHAWGAAPANLLPRFVLGVQPGAPGWARIRIRPFRSGLRHAHGIVPTPRGAVEVKWTSGRTFCIRCHVPAGLPVSIELPAVSCPYEAWVNGNPVCVVGMGEQTDGRT